MTYDEALQKVAKLLRLAKSDNQHEAALAGARAQEIIDRYKIEVIALNYDGQQPEEPIRDFREDPLETAKSSWSTRLCSCIAKSNGCRIYLSGPRINLVGRASDVATVRYLYAYLRRQVDEITRKETKGNGRTYANNFRLGVVDTIKLKLQEQKKETNETAVKELTANLVGEMQAMALVRVNQAIAKVEANSKATEDWMASNMKLGRGRATACAFHSGAREHGKRAGQQIRMTRATGSIA